MKIGFVSMPVAGHLNPMTALARRLQSRGHEVVFIGFPDVEPFARAAGNIGMSMILIQVRTCIPSRCSSSKVGSAGKRRFPSAATRSRPSW
jgi:hypothetical protein